LRISTGTDHDERQVFDTKYNEALTGQEEKRLTFTKSFLQPSSAYEHRNLLPMGQIASTPSLHVSYAMLEGPYLHDALMKCCPPRPGNPRP